MEREELSLGGLVEWLGDDTDYGLRRGHPGRITMPTWQDVFVDWVGAEHSYASGMCYGYQWLGILEEQEYNHRADRVRQGLPPLPGQSD